MEKPMDKITEEFLKDQIIKITYEKLEGTLMHCSITVKNGFIFTGESACVNNKNYDEARGREIAYTNAFNKMWLPYGFWLKQSMYESNRTTNKDS